MHIIPSTVLFSEIADRMFLRCGTPLRTSADALRVIAREISNSLIAGNRVEVRGFGSFKSKKFQGRIARNPQNGQPIDVAPRCRASFKAGDLLAKRINAAE